MLILQLLDLDSQFSELTPKFALGLDRSGVCQHAPDFDMRITHAPALSYSAIGLSLVRVDCAIMVGRS